MPTSIVPSATEKFGLPAAGIVQADADRARVVESVLRSRHDLVEPPAFGCSRPAYLPHQDLARDAAPVLPLRRRRGGDVVVRNDCLDRDSVFGGELGGHLHVHVVAGIVAVETGNPAALIGGLEAT